MTSLRFRVGDADDAAKVASLHAASWRRHYRGAYADAFLDGDVVADRRAVWSSRLAAPGDHLTVVAEHDAELAGFVHVVFDADERWGSLVDNLHVVHGRQRTGTGTALLTRAAEAVAERATGPSMYLWVLEQNTAARQFYRALGGICVERAPVPPPGGVPARLHGAPDMLRVAWSGTSFPARRTGR
ncbi:MULTISPECIES: GNAT family N-acetyltransferase [unclassified Streptomyces]|uniref:GNAT family N-acetyltransferase n=1 Tax=unclassified Streptomyces TaxID=2593676 RepID=UPI002E0FC01B|nr:GNAT family N-acetyltransferase [Streptomyces sp. NBC_01281]